MASDYAAENFRAAFPRSCSLRSALIIRNRWQ